ncbi:MAG: glycosyltransferase [Acidobacteriota bacterium]|nr:glycosyltransferase [Acidobacteriota bacterium]
MSVWFALAAALGMIGFLVKARFHYLLLPELPAEPLPKEEDISVVIPARDEEANITGVVTSFAGAPVIVVDDGSNDRTVELARQAGAAVIPAPPLDPRLMGKPNACLAGAQASDSYWILFVDADTRYQPSFLNSLANYARREKLQAASVFLKQERITWAERMLLPYAFALYFCGVNSRQVNNPKSREALANGQCLLFRRQAYDFVGTHAAVAGSVIEDVALARILKRHRMNSRVLRAEHLGSVRMYDSFGAIWRGFQKNSFRFLAVNPGSGAQVIGASILLTSYIPVLIFLLREGHRWIAAVFAVIPSLLLLPWYGSVVDALLAPAAIYVFQLIALNAMATSLFGRKAIWKGRRV